MTDANPVILTAGAADVGTRLDRFLAAQIPNRSRASLQLAIRAGAVRVHDAVYHEPDRRLAAGDAVVVTLPPEAPDALTPEPDLPLVVLHEDTDLLALNKPAGIATHPLTAGGSGTVANWLVAHVPGIREVGDEPRTRPGIVHRLDKFTSGVLVAAKTSEAFTHLKHQFQAREAEKEYLAVLDGVPKVREGFVAGYLTASVREHRRKRLTTRPLDRTSKFSRTRFAVVDAWGTGSLVRFWPETGRTHQIRVHAKSLGAPVLGDRLYGSKAALPDAYAGRFWLHAVRITLQLPGTQGQRITFAAPLPTGFVEVAAWASKGAAKPFSA